MRQLGIVLILMTSTEAFALDPIPGEERFSEMQSQESQSVATELGMTKIGDDYFITVSPRFDLNLGKIGVGLQIPLNIRVPPRTDDETETVNGKEETLKKDHFGFIRQEDWDERSEWLRAIRYVRYGHKRDPFYVRVGELAAEIGHGTIMTRYLNNLNVDSFQLGMQLDLNTSYGGIETIVNSFGNLFKKPEDLYTKLVGGRIYIKPVAFADPESVFNIFQFGFTALADLTAPYNLPDPSLTDPTAPKPPTPLLEDKSIAVYGADIGIDLLHSPILDIVPYSDLNFIQDAGWGWHLGVQAVAKLPIGLDLQVPVRLEYRRFRSDYVPSYFSTFYEVERLDYGASGRKNLQGKTKSYALQNKDSTKGINGYYGDLAFDFAGLIQVGAIYEDYDNADPNLAAFVSVPALDVVQFKAYYTRTGITGSDDIFKFDDRSTAIAQARMELVQFIYLVARASRRWSVDPTTGRVESVDDWKFGIEASFDL